MKYLIILTIALLSCTEEITPTVPLNGQQTLTISSNAVITVKIYNDSHSFEVQHDANQTQGTTIKLPAGNFSYSYECGSGLVEKKTLYLPCP